MKKLHKTVHLEVKSKLPTEFGEFKLYGYTYRGKEHIALFMGDFGDTKNNQNVLCRVHSECLTGEVMHSLCCDCKEQLETALKKIAKKKKGIFIYLRQEGRGIGLIEKIKAYNLQYLGMDTVEANEHLGHKVDLRDFGIAASILKDLRVKSVQLMTNNPQKISQLESHGIVVSARIAIIPKKITKYNKKYLNTKAKKLNHMF